MSTQQTLSTARPVAFAVIVGLLTLAVPAGAQKLSPFQRLPAGRWSERIIFAFNGADGSFPRGSVIADSSGALYGTTGDGGNLNAGVAFSLTPTPTGWTETVLHSFTGSDGGYPGGALLAGPGGTLFGAASSGGADCHSPFCLGGTVYELAPPQAGHRDWSATVLHNFSPSDPAGAAPAGTLIADAEGDLYGAAELGGKFGDGAIFELKPPPPGKSTWSTRVLHVFNPSEGDGLIPTTGLLADSSGTLYGTTEDGGSGTGCISGCGTVFTLTPPPRGHGAWTERILYSFTNTNGDGWLPYAGVVAGADGSLYGTTYLGGTGGGGIAYRLAPTPTGGWTETVLHEFSTTNGDGFYPVDALILGPHGALYGTTSFGGSQPSGNSGGIVFRLTPPHSGVGLWNEKVLHRFNPRLNGDSWAGVFQSPSGVLYGSTVVGGNPACSQGCGTIFALSPP